PGWRRHARRTARRRPGTSRGTLRQSPQHLPGPGSRGRGRLRGRSAMATSRWRRFPGVTTLVDVEQPPGSDAAGSWGSGTGRRPGRLRPGTRLGPFVVEGELGRGGMGVVLRARDEAGRPVALKIVHGLRETTLRRFSREVRALAALDHPNVVRHLGAGEQPV